VLQKAGDLLLIPAHWWHQTYALEPSLAVAGQYMNEGNSWRVMRHIAAWLGVPAPAVEGLQELPARERVDAFLRGVLPREVLENDSDWDEDLDFPLDDLA